MCPLTQGLKIIGIPDRWCRVSTCQPLNPKEVVFSRAPAPSLPFTLENLHTHPFPQWGSRRMTGVSFPATQRAVELVLVSTLVIGPFHITPLSSTYPEFTHTGGRTDRQVCGCWWTALKIVFADSTKKSKKNFISEEKCVAILQKCYFWPFKSVLFPQSCGALKVTHL